MNSVRESMGSPQTVRPSPLITIHLNTKTQSNTIILGLWDKVSQSHFDLFSAKFFNV